MSRNIEYDLREDFYRRLVNQPLSFFHELAPASDARARTTFRQCDSSPDR